MDKLTPSQALSRIKHFCAYQERCHAEVRQRLFNHGLSANEVEDILTHLISEDYLNEERFARQFAGGKFRLKKWGKSKIERELKMRQVSEYCINKALAQIDESEYEDTFYRLAERKKQSLSTEKNMFIRKRKIKDFLLAKGYGHQMIYAWLDHNY